MPKIIERTVTLPAPPPYKIYITQPAPPATPKPPKKEPPYCPTFEQGENFSAKFVPDILTLNFLDTASSTTKTTRTLMSSK